MKKQYRDYVIGLVLRDVLGKKKAEVVLDSMVSKDGGTMVYLTKGVALGDAKEIIENLEKAGLIIVDRMGCAVLLVE